MYIFGLLEIVLNLPDSRSLVMILGASSPDEIVKLGENARSGKGPGSIETNFSDAIYVSETTCHGYRIYTSKVNTHL